MQLDRAIAPPITERHTGRPVARGLVTAAMRAARLHRPDQPLRIDTLPRPVPAGGEVLVRVAAAGLGRCDLDILDGRDEVALPQTLGHEVSGYVAAIGPDVHGPALRDPVVVYGWWGCGRCAACVRGEEHRCPEARRCGGTAPGGFADFLLVPDARHLVGVEGIDPVSAAPLAGAGLTPYHAVRSVRELLLPGTAAVVVGGGGLGQLAVQLLRRLTPAQVLVVDSDVRKEGPAREAGADRFLDLLDWQGVLHALDGTPAAVVFDFAGADATLEMGARVVAPGGRLVVCGGEPGKVRLAMLDMAPGAAAVTETGGSRQELAEVVAMARAGQLRLRAQRFQLDRVNDAVTALRAGWVRGRAVIVPTMA
jgi:alcohol dehydrogenase, propanol-preferring